MSSFVRPRFIRSIMTAAEPLKKVPIPRRGVDYRGKLVLAPMVRSGELPSRLLALHYGADLVWGPETVDRSMIGTTRQYHPETKIIEWTRPPSQAASTKIPAEELKDNVIYRMHAEKEAGKLIFQIGTSDPELAVQAAKTVAADVAGIDVNAGCPKPFSTHAGMGAALLKTPDKLIAILEALVANITPQYEIGISVKIRILETAAETEALVRRLVATGITGLTVHCRTTPMRPRERAIRGQLRMVADVCREAGVACVMNGDVEDRDQALELMREFGVDGAMIATAAEKNSSCFQTKEQGGLLPWEVITEQYTRFALEVENKWGNTKYMLNQLVPGKLPVYKELAACKSYTSACEALGFRELVERAREVDQILNIDPDRTSKKKNNNNNSNKSSNNNNNNNKNIKRNKTANAVALAAGGHTAKSRSADKSTKNTLSQRGVKAAKPQATPPPSTPTEAPVSAMAISA
ncbi:tRNA-dihydrouridine synthase [Xylariaceae sp. FL0594]|nr:tRNA-dihydrouridine synthase [Xylariaceae sp. FL0594]